MLYAASVLCCPYLIVIYIIYSAAVLIKAVQCKKRGVSDCAKKLAKAWVCFTVSAAIIAVLLALFVWRNGVDISSPVKALSEIMGDPEHKKLSIYNKVKIYILHMFISRKVALCSFAGCFFILVAIKSDKKSREHRALYALAAALIAIAYLIITELRYKYINFLTVPLNIAGLVAYALADKRQKKIFKYVYIPGVLYSFLIHLGSNNNYHSITCGLQVANVASAYFIGYLAAEMWKESEKRTLGRFTAVVMVLAVVLTTGCIIKERAELSFGDTNKNGMDYVCYLTEEVTNGVGKGLIMTQEEVDAYKLTLAKTDNIRRADGDNVLYFAWETWLYLADEKDNASFSAWLSLGSPVVAAQRLLKYWELNPNKVPDAIYIEKAYDATGDIAVLLNVANYTVKEYDTWVELTK